MKNNTQDVDIPIRSIFTILRIAMPDILANKFALIWYAASFIIIIIWAIFPQFINFNSLGSLANQVVGFLGIALAIISLRAYNIEDLIHLYRDQGKPNQNTNHPIYYEYIGEFYFAAILWALALLGIVIDAIVDFSCAPKPLIDLTNILYILLLLANLFSVVGLFFHNFDRLTNKVISESKKTK